MNFIVGYPYISERHRRVFDFFTKKEDLVFILPKIWKMKKGKVIFKTESGGALKVVPARTYFFHSRYPVIRGQLKGWMPSTKKILKKMSHPGDILYSVSEPNLLVTYLNAKIARKLGLKHIFFTWQNIPYKSRLSGLKLKLTEWIIKRNIALSQGVVCGNSGALKAVRPYLPDSFPSLVAPVSGVDTERFRPDICSDFRVRYGLKEKIIVLFVGALDYRKGIFKIVDSFVDAKAKEDFLYLFMIGAGHLDRELKAYAEKRGIAKDITILPWVGNKDLPAYFSNSDIFIYPSQRYGGWEEQFGYSIAEASASCLPVISTRTGSIEDLVIDPEKANALGANSPTGLLVDPEDVAGLTVSLLKLAADKSLRKEMGKAGREHVINNFSHQIIAKKLENFLRNL